MVFLYFVHFYSRFLCLLRHTKIYNSISKRTFQYRYVSKNIVVLKDGIFFLQHFFSIRSLYLPNCKSISQLPTFRYKLVNQCTAWYSLQFQTYQFSSISQLIRHRAYCIALKTFENQIQRCRVRKCETKNSRDVFCIVLYSFCTLHNIITLCLFRLIGLSIKAWINSRRSAPQYKNIFRSRCFLFPNR